VIREQWDGKEWQEHCRRLLARRHGVDIQFIPDRFRGDGGLEAYCFDGVGYQCYAPQEAYTTSALTDAQKRKINTDIAKLRDNPEATRALLGGVVLNRWVLLTPEFDSRELVEYARKKSEKVRQDPRPFWCAEQFEIVIHRDDVFAAEIAAIYGQVAPGLHLDLPEPEEDDLFAAAAGGAAVRLESKLALEPSLAVDAQALGSFKSMLLRNYVRGRKQLDLLANEYPSMNVAIERRLKSTLMGLPVDLLGEARGPVVVQTLLRRLAEDLRRDVPGLDAVLCEEIAQYAIAQWFVDCPLYFPVPAA
jgi:hypothetical protein